MISLSDDKSLFIKSIIIGTFITIACIAAVLCICCAVFLTSSKIPYEYTDYIMLVIYAISIFIGSYFASRINKSRGLVLGITLALIMFVALLISSFSTGNANLGMMTLYKLAVLIVFGILGGIKGVNTKEKVRIK